MVSLCLHGFLFVSLVSLPSLKDLLVGGGTMQKCSCAFLHVMDCCTIHGEYSCCPVFGTTATLLQRNDIIEDDLDAFRSTHIEL